MPLIRGHIGQENEKASTALSLSVGVISLLNRNAAYHYQRLADNKAARTFVSYMLSHIHTSPSLVDTSRLEVTPHIAVTRPPNTVGIPESARLIVRDNDNLVGACPLLKAIFFECLGLFLKPLSVRKGTKPFADGNTNPKGSAAFVCQQFAIESGAYLVAPHGLQVHDGMSLEAPEQLKPRW